MAVALLLPSVLAESSSGKMVAEGNIGLPRNAVIAGVPLAAYTDDMQGLTQLSLIASKARLLEVSRTNLIDPLNATQTGGPQDIRETPLTDLRLTLVVADEAGWIGLYPEAISEVSFASQVQTLLEPTATSQVGDESNELKEMDAAYDEAFGQGRPNDPNYRRFISIPHLTLQESGAATFGGKGILKIFGPDIHIESAERRGVVTTGVASEGAMPIRQERQSWILIEYESGTLEIETRAPMTLALDSASISWSGPATFSALTGTLETPTKTYATDGHRATLTGDFKATIDPVLDSDKVVAYVDLEGTLASTTLTPQAAAPVRSQPGSSSSTPSLFIGFLAVLAMGGAGAATGAVLVHRRRRVQPVVVAEKPAAVVTVAPAPVQQPPMVTLIPTSDDGLQADDCIRFADDAAVERRWARALHWAQRARVLAPNNARIRADEGEYLFQLGLFEESLQAFEEASRLDTSEGYADYRGAQAAAAAGRPVDEVLSWLERALERSPDLVGDLELFKEFDGLRGMPAYDAMVRRAYERLGIDPASPF